MDKPEERLARIEVTVEYLKARVGRLEVALISSVVAALYVALRILGLPV